MLVSEENLDNEDYVVELLEVLKKEQVYVGSACRPLIDFLRETNFSMYKKYKNTISD